MKTNNTRQENEPLITFFGEGHFKTFYKKEEKIKLSQSEKGRDSEKTTHKEGQKGQRASHFYIKKIINLLTADFSSD